MNKDLENTDLNSQLQDKINQIESMKEQLSKSNKQKEMYQKQVQ